MCPEALRPPRPRTTLRGSHETRNLPRKPLRKSWHFFGDAGDQGASTENKKRYGASSSGVGSVPVEVLLRALLDERALQNELPGGLEVVRVQTFVLLQSIGHALGVAKLGKQARHDTGALDVDAVPRESEASK